MAALKNREAGAFKRLRPSGICSLQPKFDSNKKLMLLPAVATFALFKMKI